MVNTALQAAARAALSDAQGREAGGPPASAETTGSRCTLAIVGGGPSSTYVIGQLAAIARASGIAARLEIEIFDRSGEFGAGEVHSACQPASSVLNRVAGQIAFAADESNAAANLLPPSMRPSFHEWCRQKFQATGCADFDLAPEDWPKRYVHGLALREMFERYADELRACRGVSVRCHHDSVIDVERRDDGRFRLVTATARAPAILADHILFVTGHSYNDPATSPETARLAHFALVSGAARYVPCPYPLEARLQRAVGAESVVGIAGMGVTAIDVILYLTEDRGGQFMPCDTAGTLAYVASGAEPRSIVAFGATGLFTFARPFNAKERDIANLEHKGVFLTREAIARLRQSQGQARDVPPVGRRLQLDFERHVFPLIVLEMAYIYYGTLYGPTLAASIRLATAEAYADFLRRGAGTRDEAIDRLLAPVQSCAEQAEVTVAAALDRGAGDSVVLCHYLTTVYGGCLAKEVLEATRQPARLTDVLAAVESPWRHPREPRAHRFDWRRLSDPIGFEGRKSGAEFAAALVDFMEWDHLQAGQDNIRNPSKAACDGVWRDLRPVIAEAVDFGGLTASSHRRFLEVYMRHHNRLANGAGLIQMQKMLALVRAGILDVSIGPEPSVDVDLTKGCFVVSGRRTGEVRELHTLIDGKVHPFNPDTDASPLFRNLIARGLVRKWRNPDDDQRAGFEPGGLDLTRDFHPVHRDGSIDTALTLLGPPTEGVMFFQLGAARPKSNHHILNDVVQWVEQFIGQLHDAQAVRTRHDSARHSAQ